MLKLAAARDFFAELLAGGIPQQHGVRFRVAALEGELGAVWRKRKLPDSLRREMRELPVRRAIQRSVAKN
jgi:hypothetical protein